MHAENDTENGLLVSFFSSLCRVFFERHDLVQHNMVVLAVLVHGLFFF